MHPGVYPKQDNIGEQGTGESGGKERTEKTDRCEYSVYHGWTDLYERCTAADHHTVAYRYMGAKQLGELLYITGLVAIICPSIGQALNTSRLVVRRSHEVTNGDYDWFFCCLECWEAVWRCLCQETVSEGSLWVSGYLPFLW